MDIIAKVCEAMPSLTLDDCLDMDYDRLFRLYEVAARKQYEWMCNFAQFVATGIGMAFSKQKVTLPTWEELKRYARRLEEFKRSPFVVKGRQSLARSKNTVRDSG